MLSRGIRGGAGRLARPAAHVAAAALVVTAMAAAMRAGPLVDAGARTQSHAASTPPARVKFYIVPPPQDGSAESLFSIAATTLGDGSRFMEIFNLNKGRLQPNGGRLTSPQTIDAGWILQLPADATGPGVHAGPLPAVTAPASHRPPRPAAGVAASSHFPSLPGGAGRAIVISGALLAFLAAGLAFGLIRRRATLREIPEIRQQAAYQAGHAREAAERDAAELRATLVEMSAELGRVAAHVTGILQSTAKPATARAAWPDKSPAPPPAARSATRPARPTTMPGEPPTRPAKPAAKPAARSRQFRAARLPVLAMGVAILFGLIAATTEMALHGYDFFVFRPPGTGATQQGPPGPALSQPPTAHRHHRATGWAAAGTRGAHHHLRPDGAQATSTEGR